MVEGIEAPVQKLRRRRVDQALWSVIMTAYITGTSTRKVDDLVRALDCAGRGSKSTVSRICKGIDDEVAAFRTRPLGHLAMPYSTASSSSSATHMPG